MHTTRTTLAPAASTAFTAWSALPPVVSTSSITTARPPGLTTPSTSDRLPWALASLRTKNPSAVRPRRVERDERGRGHRDRPDFQPADAVELDVGDGVREEFAEQGARFGVEQHFFRVDVVARLLARRQREVAELERPVAEQVLQAGAGVRAWLTGARGVGADSVCAAPAAG